MCRIDFFFHFGLVLVQFSKNSNLVWNEFGSVGFEKLLFGWGVTYYLRNS